MKLWKFCTFSGLAGLIVPIVLSMFGLYIEKYHEYELGKIDLHYIFEKIILLLWPTSIIGMSAQTDDIMENAIVASYSVISNVMLYMLLGIFVWLLRRAIR